MYMTYSRWSLPRRRESNELNGWWTEGEGMGALEVGVDISLVMLLAAAFFSSKEELLPVDVV